MNLQGVAMVRNEADIIEAFIRHNLTRLDGLIIIDHGSADETLRIIVALAKEGLPVSVLANAQPGYAQLEMTTIAVRHAFATTPADFVFPLDADEFIKTPSRPEMERVLAEAPSSAHPLMTWQTYVPDFSVPYTNAVDAARTARRLPKERHGYRKVVVARHFTTTPRAVVMGGNHRVLPWHGAFHENLEPDHILPKRTLALAHLPIRGKAQFIAKTVVKRLARMAVDRDWSEQWDRRKIYHHIVEGGHLDAEYIRGVTVNLDAGGERSVDPATIELVVDPFLADFDLRYTPMKPVDPMPLVLAAVEQLAALEARARRLSER
jgi:glycosyltransferase involved in cell wall biosynthesis